MAEKDAALTPMMRQFYELKAKHPDAVLLFRCGDFYETYCSDAVVASEILGITLTKRSNGKSDASKAIEMAGFPFHALDTYLPKLVRAGKRVAICDQLEDPKMTKKLVKRGITELVTPGVSINDNVLDYKENNFLAAVHFGKPMCGVSFLDISTGEYLVAEGTFDYIEKLLINFRPKEILVERGLKGRFIENFGTKFLTFELDDWAFTDEFAHEKLTKHFETKNLKGFGISHLRSGVVAAGAILHYLEVTLHTRTPLLYKSGIYLCPSFRFDFKAKNNDSSAKHNERLSVKIQSISDSALPIRLAFSIFVTFSIEIRIIPILFAPLNMGIFL